MSKIKNANRLTGKEVRAIAKQNKKIIKKLEAYKNRKADEAEYLGHMSKPENILEIDNLHTYFFTEQGIVKAVNGVSFDIPKNTTVGVVGESGCGKSVTSMSVMRLIQGPTGQIFSGSIRFNAKLDSGETKVYDIAKMPMDDIHKIRGNQIAMIFQEPMTSLNPVFTIGQQLDEVTFINRPEATKEEAKEKSLQMLDLVGIAMPERVYDAYPHELSGGMRQRVMISMALASDPRLIIADEPTTALDVTIQAQILDLLRDLKTRIDGSIMLITHDLGVVAEMADYVVVMYAGKVIEMGTVEDIFDRPLHPYTIGLQKSKPTVDQETDELYCIPGFVPNPIDMPNYCYFRDRCDKCMQKCSGEYPHLIKVTDTHSVSCYLYEKEKEN
jgi:peptide/nickel transport system ATP-binding protein